MPHPHCTVSEIQVRNSRCGWMTDQRRPICGGGWLDTPKDQKIVLGKDSIHNTQLCSHYSKRGGLLYNPHSRRKTLHRAAPMCPTRRLPTTSYRPDRPLGSTCVDKFTSRFMLSRACSQGATPRNCAQTRCGPSTP